MILRQLPDHRLADTPANAAFRAWFYARWGRENAVITGRASRAEFAPFTQALSVKRAWGGQETYLLPGRQLAVDDDHLLVLQAGVTYGARIAGDRPVTSLAVFFRPGLADEVATAAATTTRQALDDGVDRAAARAPAFAEHLRPADDDVGARLLQLYRDVQSGEDDDAWLEERLQALLAAMLRAEPGWHARAERLADLSHGTRQELLRRVDRATDLLLSGYTQPLTLADLAQAAGLSRFHLLRAFARVHGRTPMALRTQLRVRHARRLLADTSLPLEDVAAASGLGTRQTLFRQLQRHAGAGGQALRQGLRPAPADLAQRTIAGGSTT